MAHSLIHFKNVLEKQSDGNARLNIIYCWVLGESISFKEFKELLKYHRQLDYVNSTKEEVENDKQSNHSPSY